MKKFVCSVCGYVHVGDEAPEFCPICKAPRDKFYEQTEETGYATEHVIGVGAADKIEKDVYEGLVAHFNGECCEVGMYLAMSRQADREGYPEIAEAFKKYAFEETPQRKILNCVQLLRRVLVKVNLKLQNVQNN